MGDAFLGQPFIEKRESTVGANVKVMRTGGGSNTNWKELKPKEKEDIIDQVLVRGFLASIESRQQIESTEETKMTSQETAETPCSQQVRSTNTVALSTVRQATSKEGNMTELGSHYAICCFLKN